MGQGAWDLVYDLWGMWLEAFEEYISSGKMTVGVMGQPLEFTIRDAGTDQVAFIYHDRRTPMNRRDFFGALLPAARRFFGHLHHHSLVSDDELQWAEARIADIERHLGLEG